MRHGRNRSSCLPPNSLVPVIGVRFRRFRLSALPSFPGRLGNEPTAHCPHTASRAYESGKSDMSWQSPVLPSNYARPFRQDDPYIETLRWPCSRATPGCQRKRTPGKTSQVSAGFGRARPFEMETSNLVLMKSTKISMASSGDIPDGFSAYSSQSPSTTE